MSEPSQLIGILLPEDLIARLTEALNHFGLPGERLTVNEVFERLGERYLKDHAEEIAAARASEVWAKECYCRGCRTKYPAGREGDVCRMQLLPPLGYCGRTITRKGAPDPAKG